MQKKLKKIQLHASSFNFFNLYFTCACKLMSLFFYINNGWRVGFGIKLQPRIKSIEVFEIIVIIIFKIFFYLIVY
jgi:hypothetical protein